MLEEIAGAIVLFTVLGLLAYTQAPRHWQTVGGFFLIVFGWMPVAFIVICIVKEPVIAIPAAFLVGASTISRKRA